MGQRRQGISWGVLASSAALLLAALPASAQDTARPAAVTEAQPLPAPMADLTARLAYNTDRGPLIGAGFVTDRLFGPGRLLKFSFEASEDDSRVSLSFLDPALFGESPAVGIEVFHNETRSSDTFRFDTSSTGLRPSLTWREAQTTTRLYLSASRDEIDDIASGSRLVLADAGERRTLGLGATFSHRWPVTAAGPLRDARISFSPEVGRHDDETTYLRATTRLATTSVFAEGAVQLSTEFRAGMIETEDGASSIGDRFFIGSSGLRGFAFGGLGPRDLAVEDEPALGGNRFALARVDAQFPGAFGGEGRLTPGVFLDTGSLWGLDDAGGGAAGAIEVDDEAHLRSAVGVSLRIDIGLGPIRLNIAHPVEHEDYDELQTVSLSFARRF